MRVKIFVAFTVICLLCVAGLAQPAVDRAQAHEPDAEAKAVASESQPAPEAGKQLNLAVSQAAAKPEGRTDRLADIPDNVSPIMTVATIAFKAGAPFGGPGSDSGLGKEFPQMLAAMKHAKGFMGLRLLQSNDNPPIFVAISWWKDKKSLVDWYYHPAHMKLVNLFYSGNGASSTPVKDVITHIGLQFYAPLRAGTAVGEPFGPTQKPVD
jgi:heme-degrading monooxygenase HmoA